MSESELKVGALYYGKTGAAREVLAIETTKGVCGDRRVIPRVNYYTNSVQSCASNYRWCSVEAFLRWKDGELPGQRYQNKSGTNWHPDQPKT